MQLIQLNARRTNNTIKKMGKIIANETTEKILISKIYNQLIQLNAKKTTNFKKWEKRSKQTFIQ